MPSISALRLITLDLGDGLGSWFVSSLERLLQELQFSMNSARISELARKLGKQNFKTKTFQLAFQCAFWCENKWHQRPLSQLSHPYRLFIESVDSPLLLFKFLIAEPQDVSYLLKVRDKFRAVNESTSCDRSFLNSRERSLYNVKGSLKGSLT